MLRVANLVRYINNIVEYLGSQDLDSDRDGTADSAVELENSLSFPSGEDAIIEDVLGSDGTHTPTYGPAYLLIPLLNADPSGVRTGAFWVSGSAITPDIKWRKSDGTTEAMADSVDVSYATLDANGSVGNVAGKVATGDHTH